MSENVDAISSMIYPSHWSNGICLDAPIKNCTNSKSIHSKVENSLLDSLGKKKPISRPWIQDSTASYLGDGNYIDYDATAF